mgnify:FL=1|tara:strand:- start:9476 stop:10462 length:987 start_codon:yes stop_codon:yes gene_type:complete
MKIQKIFLALILMLPALLSDPARVQAQSSAIQQDMTSNILLRPDAIVEGQYVTLGDIFSGIDPQISDLAVAHAPQPGRQTVLDYRWLYGIAQRHNVPWRPRTTADQIVITRASQTISIDEISDAVKDALVQHGIKPPFAVDLSGETFQIHLPVDVPAMVEITGLDVNQRTNRFIANVTTGSQTAQRRTYRMSGRYYPLAQVPVIIEPIRRGAIVRPDQVEYRDMRAERVPAGTIRDIDDVIGKEALRPIKSDEPLLFRDFSNPILVRRGALVVIRLVTANMSLTARGKALEDGSKGSVIRVMNLASNKTIQVEVVAENEVRALPAMSQ